PESQDAVTARHFALTLLLITSATVLLVRGEILRPGPRRALVYRLGAFVPMLASYFELRYLLPALQPVLLDAQLQAIDTALLGVTPSIWMSQFNTLHAVEWISFFYYSYFYVLGSFLLPTLFLDRGQRMHQLLIGALVVAALGHITYTLVPGVGPHATLDFEPLAGGFWWGLVEATVSSAGAQYDIFPSLHTAFPTFFAIHSFANRDQKPFRYVWPIIAFFAANTILATMFLRWHWFIDVIAGLCLAALARAIGAAVARHEAPRLEGDRRDERQPVWEPLFRWQR
ncbi:MAG: phosphatase PAP2 family protein, partial [Myxococcales bacterium]|nr:phosphatase PAP2 family protein [Myxococcales bacterium]